MEEKETIHINLLTELTGNLISEEAEWEDEWTENDAYGMPLDGTDLAWYESAIREELNRYGEDDLMQYFPGSASIQEKVKSAVVTIENQEGILYGCTKLELKEFLNPEELKELGDYITGQYSDGWGEGFEQQEIPVEGGELYVHFWQPRDYLFEQVKPEIPKKQEPEKKKPKMELLGRDGNVFIILGTAAGLLIKEGMDQQANEMYKRVMQSDNYYQALHIISEYVETELSVSDEKSQARKSQILECIQSNKKKSKKQPER